MYGLLLKHFCHSEMFHFPRQWENNAKHGNGFMPGKQLVPSMRLVLSTIKPATEAKHRKVRENM